MRTPHYISLAVALGLIVLLYFGVNTIPPPEAAKGAAGSDAPHAGAASQQVAAVASFDSIAAAARKALPAHAAQELQAIETKLAAIPDSSGMAPLFEEMATLWQEHRQLPMMAWTKARAAHLAHSEKSLNFAGQIFLDLMHGETTPAMQLWAAQQAVDCFEQALAINPDNDTTKMALAMGYMEGTGEPMKGVNILRGITAEKPNDIPANLMLGRLSIQSGQYDKAIARYETVLQQEPANREALYFMAEAYRGKGDKGKAIALLEQCKKIVNDPGFSRDIDEYINSFK